MWWDSKTAGRRIAPTFNLAAESRSPSSKRLRGASDLALLYRQYPDTTKADIVSTSFANPPKIQLTTRKLKRPKKTKRPNHRACLRRRMSPDLRAALGRTIKPDKPAAKMGDSTRIKKDNGGGPEVAADGGARRTSVDTDPATTNINDQRAYLRRSQCRVSLKRGSVRLAVLMDASIQRNVNPETA